MIKKFIKSFYKSSGSAAAHDFDVVLHIGAPKSGSSAIQRFCVSHRDELLKLGYYYPKHRLDINGVSGGHTLVAGALRKEKFEEAEPTFQSLLETAGAHDAVLLLSAEAFYVQPDAMAELCKGLRVKVVAFMRHPVEYILANHNQGVKRNFSTQRLGSILPGLLRRNVSHFSGLPLLRWADAFGADNCCFIAYQSPSAGGKPVEGRFLQALGLGEAQVGSLIGKLQGMTNRSYVKSALELKRLLNTVLKDMPVELAHQVDWSLQGYSDRTEGESGYTLSDLTPEMRKQLEEHLLKQMAPVVERFPQLKAIAELPAGKSQVQSAGFLNLAAPLEALEADVPKAVEKIHQRAVVQRDEGQQDYVFCKLLDTLGIEFSEPEGAERLPGLVASQRSRLEKPNVRVADCLREMAVVFKRQGLFDDALFVIERAAEKRPEGKRIQSIKAGIERKKQAARKSVSRQTAQPEAK